MNRRFIQTTLATTTVAPVMAQQPTPPLPDVKPPAGQNGNKREPMSNRYLFLGGKKGIWKVTRMGSYRGPGLEGIERIDVLNREMEKAPPEAAWVLQGFTSNVRYATKDEVAALRARQPALNRPEATCAALIPIKKSALWWDMSQDERRSIFEETSHHTLIGLDYLPAIARRLHHCRDIGEPFDFLTCSPGSAHSSCVLLF